MASCDPFRLADEFLARLKKLRERGQNALDAPGGFPGSVSELLECVVTGTADRAAAGAYPSGYGPYDLEAFKRQVRTIYESVAIAADETGDRITGSLLHSSPMNSIGIWFSGNSGDTFHGLVMAKAQTTGAEAAALRDMLSEASRLAADLQEAVGGIAAQESSARSLSDVLCPEMAVISEGFRQIAADVAATGSLGRAYCGASTLRQKVEALLAKLPEAARQPVSRAVEITAQLQDVAAAADRSLERLLAAQDAIPAFDAQIEVASHVPSAEDRIHRAVADQFDGICADIGALGALRRHGEMQAAVQKIDAVGAVALDVLASSPSGRVSAVRSHPAALPFEAYADRLRLISKVEGLVKPLDDFQSDLTLAFSRGNDRALGRVAELQDAIGAVDAFADEIDRASAEYQEAVAGLVDEICAGILTRLIASTGYQEIEKLILDGLFGDIPEITQQAASTIGVLVSCVQEFAAGACRTLPDNGPQRFALDRLSDVTKAAERVQEFVADAGARIQGARESLTGSLDRLAAAVQQDVRAAIGAPPRTVPGDSDAAQGVPSSPRETLPKFGCPSAISADADGYLHSDTPYGLPPGVSRRPDGLLVHDGVEPVPPGTVRGADGMLKQAQPAAPASRALKPVRTGIPNTFQDDPFVIQAG